MSPLAGVIVLADGYGQAQMLRDALGYQTSVVGRAWTGKQDRELISASVSKTCRWAGGNPESAPHHAEQAPTGVLPMAIVVDLAAVEIEEQTGFKGSSQHRGQEFRCSNANVGARIEHYAAECRHQEARDPLSGDLVQLFHPRRNGWAEHFRLHLNGRIEGRTAIGRATVAQLAMNRRTAMRARRLWLGTRLLG